MSVQFVNDCLRLNSCFKIPLLLRQNYMTTIISTGPARLEQAEATFANDPDKFKEHYGGEALKPKEIKR